MVRAEIGERRHALAYPGSVAHLEKMYLAARALAREPALERDFVSRMMRQFFDINSCDPPPRNGPRRDRRATPRTGIPRFRRAPGENVSCRSSACPRASP